jgi:formate dehydrogenase subunit gamma
MCARAATRERIRGDFIIRFDVHQRAQHTLMFCSFAILAVTGLPLKYSGWSASARWMGLWGGIDNMRVVHRYAALVMIMVCVYHLLYLLFKRPLSTAMLPRPKDLGDFIQDLKHTFHLSKEPPRFDRFSYRNKAAYWLAFAGAVVITVSGLVLTYPIGAAERLGTWAYPLALVVHGDAAVLGVGWMVLVHMYFAHFSRHVFPMDKSIFTGRVPIERYREEFPLEYERIMAAAGRPVTAAKQKTPKASEEQPEATELGFGEETASTPHSPL